MVDDILKGDNTEQKNAALTPKGDTDYYFVSVKAPYCISVADGLPMLNKV